MDSVFQQIQFDFRHGKLSHAVLLDGGTEERRLKTAQEIAKMLVCTGENAPCCTCAHCLKASDGMHPDIFLFSGGTSVGSFKVDMVREIRQQAMVLPNEAARKVFILQHAETMAVGAQNALLKILEEPPSFVSFILTCTSDTQMLETIRSRVSIYSLRDEIGEQSSEVQQQAKTIAQNIVSAISENRDLDVLKETAKLEKDKELFQYCCTEIASLSAQALKTKLTDTASSSAVCEISSKMARETLYTLIHIANQTIQYIAGNINGNLLLSHFCAQLCAAGNGRT